MSRRKTQLFNLSFLDLLTSALGAVIFLFVITPKGGQSAAPAQQAAVYFDTSQMKLYGDLHDSLLQKRAGDTLFAVLVGHKNLPKASKALNKPIAQQKPERKVPAKSEVSTPERKVPKKEEPKKEPTKVPEPRVEQPKAPPVPTYRGDAPSVPCKVSIEMNWSNKTDNVDLFVCKGNLCVYGGRKKDRQIGQWDSGKARNRLFGNDLRTNQEAIRQFDQIIPGEYKIYAQFKESAKNTTSILVKGLIYTKNEQGQERGESFSKVLTLGQDRILIGTIILKEDGFYNFKKS